MVSEIDVFEYTTLNIVDKEEILRLRTVDLAFYKFSYWIKGKNNKVLVFYSFPVISMILYIACNAIQDFWPESM